MSFFYVFCSVPFKAEKLFRCHLLSSTRLVPPPRVLHSSLYNIYLVKWGLFVYVFISSRTKRCFKVYKHSSSKCLLCARALTGHWRNRSQIAEIQFSFSRISQCSREVDQWNTGGYLLGQMEGYRQYENQRQNVSWEYREVFQEEVNIEPDLEEWVVFCWEWKGREGSSG